MPIILGILPFAGGAATTVEVAQQIQDRIQAYEAAGVIEIGGNTN